MRKFRINKFIAFFPPYQVLKKSSVVLYCFSDQTALFLITLGWKNRLWITELRCENKMPTRCNRGIYCRSYCLHNMFRAPLCPSSEAQEYYTVVAACGISCCGYQVASLMWSWGLCVRFEGCCSILQTGRITLSSTSDQQLEKNSTKYHRQQPLYNTLELLMMGIVVPETCWASNKICNKYLCCI